MGGNTQQKKTNNMIDDQYNSNNATRDRLMGSYGGDKLNYQKKSDDAYGSALNSYNRMADGSMDSLYDPSADTKNSVDNMDAYGNKFASGQGIDLSGVGGGDDTLKRIMGDGGISDMNAARGYGVFKDFADNGGYSADDISNIRQRATSTIPSMFESMKRNASGSAYGNPGQAALMSRMGKQQAQATADAALNAELGIKDKVNSGKEWGASAGSGAELGIADVAGRNSTNAASALNSSQLGRAGLDLSGREFGVNTLGDNTNRRIGLDQYKSNNITTNLNNAAAGYGNLYKGAAGQQQDASNNELNAYGTTGQLNNGLINSRIGNNPKSNWFSSFLGMGGSLAKMFGSGGGDINKTNNGNGKPPEEDPFTLR